MFSYFMIKTLISIRKQKELGFLNKYIDNLAIAKLGRMEMFYLTTYSTHFINGYMASGLN